MPEGVEASLYGVTPHMHERGRKYRLRVSEAGEPAECAIDVQRWDFHWQRTYFHAKVCLASLYFTLPLRGSVSD